MWVPPVLLNCLLWDGRIGPPLHYWGYSILMASTGQMLTLVNPLLGIPLPHTP